MKEEIINKIKFFIQKIVNFDSGEVPSMIIDRKTKRFDEAPNK